MNKEKRISSLVRAKWKEATIAIVGGKIFLSW